MPGTVRDGSAEFDELLLERLDEVVPGLMQRHEFEAWVLVAREYNEDPVLETMLPATWLGNARRRTILVFKDFGRTRAAIARYPVGPFASAWDPESQPDQWAALAEYLAGVEGTIGVNASETFALADGLSASERDLLTTALPEAALQSADHVAIGWLETRLDREIAPMRAAAAKAHGLLRRALSEEVISPGSTTTHDVAWWLRQQASDAGYGSWFHPGVTVQRQGEDRVKPSDTAPDVTIVPGDLAHIDFGIVDGIYHTDQQQHAYVLELGETGAPPSLARGMAEGNRLQDILMEEMAPGRTGNEVLASTRNRAISEGIRPVVYTHPLGLHGHAAGATIGLWDQQDGVPGHGDFPLGGSSCWSIELAVEIDIEEWGGQPGRIMLEEDAFLGAEGVEFLDGRQTELWLIGN